MGLFTRSQRRSGKKALASAVMERLEDRTLLSVSVGAIANQTPPTGKPVIVAVNGTDSSSLPLAFTADSSAGNVTATLDTGAFVKISVANFGDMVFQLLPGIAPNTVTNFLNLVNSGYYNGLQIPRVVSNFVIQAGSPFNNTGGGPGYTFDDEFNLGAIFDGTGQLAMANSGKDTNGSQFFVTVGQQRELDFNHAIFGQLVSGGATAQTANYANGLAVLAAIDAVATNGSGVPNTPITMTSVSVIQDTQDAVFTISNTAVGGATVTIHASDGTTTGSTSFTVTPAADTVNDPPILNPVKDQITATTTSATQVTLTRQDFENNTATFATLAIGPSRTGDYTSGSAVISNVGNTLNLSVGMAVTSSAFSGTRHIASLTDNTITLDANFATTSTGVTFSFNPGVDSESVSSGVLTVTPTGGFIGIDHVLVGVADAGASSRGSSSDPYDKQAIDVYMTNDQSPDAVYVIQGYDQFLNRGVDAPSFTARMADLNAGTSRVAEVLGIENSHEAHVQDVNNLEFNYLFHEAPVADLTSASTYLDGGGTIEGLKEQLLGGAEYFAIAGSTNAGFVTQLYKDILNRLPDSAGQTNFLNLLSTGTSRQQVAQDIIESPEARTFFVNQQYHRFLDRAPTSDELSASVTLLNNGTTDEQVIANIMGSDEYLNTVYARIAGTPTNVATQAAVVADTPNAFIHDQVTFTATITASGATPTGTVTLFDGATSLGTQPVANKTATFTVSTLALGDHPAITVVYTGDTYFAGATSPAIDVSVSLRSSHTAVAPSTSSGVVNTPITFTATVSSANGNPTGTVTLFDGATSLGTQAVANDVATFSISSLALGDHPQITAVYSGDSNFSGSTSPAIDVTVSALGSQTALATSTQDAVLNSTITLTATVSGGSAPTGSVTFKDGNTVLGSAPVASRVATFNISTLAFGVHSQITATYTGDSIYAASTSSALDLFIGNTRNQVLVNSLYRQLLNRDAEETNSGLFYWTGRLDNGEALSVVADGIATSVEYDSDLVTSIYQQYLHRGTDPTGLHDWVAQMQAGTVSYEQIRGYILGSQEFYNNMINQYGDYLTGLYQTLLGRNPDATGIAAWTPAGGASAWAPPAPDNVRDVASIGISTSFEQFLDFVTAKYHQFLGRDPSPALAASLPNANGIPTPTTPTLQGEQGFWADSLNHGTTDGDFIADILSSNEYLILRGLPTA
jgi:cyclophilin family peptidyl-prolyl cis-trans isomerase